ncbi:response regulator transcription factor [Embleya sp. NPDC059237]|uniref:response regulator transcription factor n=1 Tax=Embleya sp. NPDC059237 TaxID=3346784 RepID=UPI0036D15EE5
MNPPIRVLVVDDHAVIRDGITAMLASRADLSAAGEAADGPTAVRRRSERPNYGPMSS